MLLLQHPILKLKAQTQLASLARFNFCLAHYMI